MIFKKKLRIMKLADPHITDRIQPGVRNYDGPQIDNPVNMRAILPTCELASGREMVSGTSNVLDTILWRAEGD